MRFQKNGRNCSIEKVWYTEHLLASLNIIFDDEVMEMDFDASNNPFSTIGSLAQFVSNKLS